MHVETFKTGITVFIGNTNIIMCHDTDHHIIEILLKMVLNTILLYDLVSVYNYSKTEFSVPVLENLVSVYWYFKAEFRCTSICKVSSMYQYLKILLQCTSICKLSFSVLVFENLVLVYQY